jgi:hypothetical protein
MSMPRNMDTMFGHDAGCGGVQRAGLGTRTPCLLWLCALALITACCAGPEAQPPALSEAMEDSMKSTSPTTIALNPAIAPIDAQVPAVLERASFGLG